MRGIALIRLSVVLQCCARESLGNSVVKLVGNVVAKLFEQTFKTSSVRRTSLGNSTLGKSSHTVPATRRSAFGFSSSSSPISRFLSFPLDRRIRTLPNGVVRGLSGRKKSKRLPRTNAEIAVESSPASAGSDAVDDSIKAGVDAVGHIVAVASCKGGVGKSTTAVNLAFALSRAGKRVGIVDLDIHGSSLPTMVHPEAKLETVGTSLLPLMRDGVKMMSMGFINPGAMPLRGARVIPFVQQLVSRTLWGTLDYLIVDMPPGTGDVHLTLSQDFRVSAAVLVTTPQRLSFVDVIKGVEMFDKVGIPTIAVVENMNGVHNTQLIENAEKLIKQHALSESAASDIRELLRTPRPIFGASHVNQLKDRWGITASFSLPLLPELAASSDNGVPFVVTSPKSEAAAVYASLAKAVDKECSALATRQLPLVFYSPDDKLVRTLLVDGSEQQISPIELRKLCLSPINTPNNLPDDLYPLDIVPMGNYAISVRWSDGHQSLFPYQSFLQGYDA